MLTISRPNPHTRVHARLAACGSGAMAISLVSCLVGGLAISPPALAYDQATFTISAKHNADAVYEAYRIFSADLTPNGGTDPDFPDESYPPDAWPGIATHINWASEQVKSTVLSYIAEHGYREWIVAEYGSAADGQPDETQYGLAQNAAAFISRQIGASPDDADAATVPSTKAAKSFALELARSLSASQIQAQSVAADSTGTATFTGEEGFYLFITSDESLQADEAGTSPIWVPLGGKTSQIDEKSAIPTLDKQVREDSTGEYGKVADANNAQDLDYRLIATMPDNIGAFDSYALTFTDTLSEGMEFSGKGTSSVMVTLSYHQGGNSYTLEITDNSHVSKTVDGKQLVVAIDDLLKVGPVIDKDATVTVDYRAHLTDAAKIGSDGNLNSAVLTYTSNPTTDATGTTPEDSHRTRTCTWQLDLNKVDKRTGTPLQNATFSIQVEPADGSLDSASAGLYLQRDGTLASEAYEFTTDSSGCITVPRIDSGSYVIHEVSAPSGYELQDADIRLNLAPTLDQSSGSVTKLEATLSGGESAQDDAEVRTHLVNEPNETSGIASSGIVSIQTSDDKKTALPITGLEGIAAASALGVGAVLAGLAGLLTARRARRDEAAPTEDR